MACQLPSSGIDWGRPGHLEGARDTALSPQELEARVPEGQHLFENLLRGGPARGTSEELEELRYGWMLYKSKLKDSSRLLVGTRDARAPGPGQGAAAEPRHPLCSASPRTERS